MKCSIVNSLDVKFLVLLELPELVQEFRGLNGRLEEGALLVPA